MRKNQLSAKQRQLKKLEKRISALVELSTSNLQDEEVHTTLESIIEEHDEEINQLGQDDVKKIFWNQQVCIYVLIRST